MSSRYKVFNQRLRTDNRARPMLFGELGKPTEQRDPARDPVFAPVELEGGWPSPGFCDSIPPLDKVKKARVGDLREFNAKHY
jgi:hypothetical protein